ncbi:MAG: RNA polymerase sigma factor [Ilumatobacteraceae bacterium]|nr:RNA polymerase sigma factor [Ilumatobacteraceae bacterium]
MADSSELYRRHADELVRYATALVGPADAPDVVVDAVVTAFASPGWLTVENQRAYLYRAVLNRSLSMRRTDARRVAREERVAVSDSVVAHESSVDALRALAGLSPQQRAVIYLTYWDDLTPTQVAALLGVSEGTVRKQLARAREQLRRILQ